MCTCDNLIWLPRISRKESATRISLKIRESSLWAPELAKTFSGLGGFRETLDKKWERQSQKSYEQRREKEENLKNQMSKCEKEKKTSKDWQFSVETAAVALSPGLRCCTSGSRSPGRLFALVRWKLVLGNLRPSRAHFSGGTWSEWTQGVGMWWWELEGFRSPVPYQGRFSKEHSFEEYLGQFSQQQLSQATNLTPPPYRARWSTRSSKRSLAAGWSPSPGWTSTRFQHRSSFGWPCRINIQCCCFIVVN